MATFLQSGRRRDICALLAGERLQAQALKSRLESHYDERIEPRSFYGFWTYDPDTVDWIVDYLETSYGLVEQ